MAEPHDENPPGRLLFTDFDASDKGRPVAALSDFAPSGGAAGYAAPGMLSLEQFASTLDLDFEDDAEPAKPDHPPPAPSLDDDDALSQATTTATADPGSPAAGFSMPSLHDDEWLYENSSLPTWEQFVNSFSDATAQSNQSAAAFPEQPHHFASQTKSAGDDDDYTQFPTDAYLMVEGDGYEGFDDLLTDAGEDVDILSIIPPAPVFSDDDGEQVHQPFAGRYRGARLGVKPPRRNPYGGIKRLTEWFRPPEPGKEAEEDHTVQPVENWYEPPEDYLPGDRQPLPRDDGEPDILDDRRASAAGDDDSTDFNVFSGDETTVRNDDTDVIYKSAQEETDGTRLFDVFDQMDLDAAWQEKINKGSNSSASSRFRSATRDHDVFSDLDIDAIWENQHGSQDNVGNDTIILNKDQLDNTSTVILTEEDLGRRYQEHGKSFSDLHAPAEALPASPWEDVWRETRHSGLDNPELIDSGDAVGFLDDLDGIAAENQPSATASQQEKAGKAKTESKTPAPSAPEKNEELNLDALIADTDSVIAETRNVTAPIIADDDIETDTQRMEREFQGKPESEQSGDPFAIPERPVDDSVMPPAISDDDLETPGTAGTGEKSGTRVMRSLFGDRKTGPSGDDDGEGEIDEADQSKSEEEVAVNPLDVFANMDGMDFSDDDGLDDEMRAMLEEDDSDQSESDLEAPVTVEEPVPTDLKGKAFYHARRISRTVFSRGLLSRIPTMIAWKENWWFYCDLLAALIASASLAVIISYYTWYR